jgi:hypothetical protein
MLARGVLWGGFHTMCFSHTDADVDQVLGAYRGALTILKDALDRGEVRARLRGEPVEPVFRKTQNFHMKPKRA